MNTKTNMRNSNIPLGRPSLAILQAASAVLGWSTVQLAQADTYSTAVVQDKPLAYYRFNEVVQSGNVNVNVGSLGAAGNATNINLHTIPGAIVGSQNRAAYFDSSARTIIPWTAALNPNASNSFTVEAWFYPTSDKVAGSFAGPAPIMNRYSYSGANRQGWVYFQRNPDDTYSSDGQSDVGWNFRTYTGNGSSTGIDITSQVPYRLGEWQHVVTVWDGPSQTASIYINGVLSASGGGAPGLYTANTDDHDPVEAVNGAAGVSIGSYNNTQPGSNPFRGAVDEFAMYNKALDASHILAHYQNATNAARAVAYDALVKSDAPVAYLHLDDAVTDTAIALNLGLLQNDGAAAYRGQVKAAAPSPLADAGDKSYAFHWRNNGAASVNIPWNAANNPDATVPFTFESWLRPLNDQQNPGPSPFNNRLANGAQNRTGWVVYQRAPNDTYSGVSGYEGVGWNFRMYTGSGSGHSDVTSDVPYNLGEWQHVVTTWDGAGSLKMYVNGELASATDGAQYSANTSPNAAPDDGHDPVDFAVGSYNAASGFGENFEGDIDEVAFYNGYVLTDDQIKLHYQTGTNAHPAVNYETLVLTAPYDGASTQALQPATYLRFNESSAHPAANTGTLGDSADGSLVLSNNSILGPVGAGFDTGNAAVALDGTLGWVSLNDPSGLEISGLITLEAWVNPALTQGDTARIISHGPPTPSNYLTPDVVETNGLVSLPNEVYLRIEGTGATYAVGTSDGTNTHGASFAVPAGDLGGNQWIHLAGVYNGTQWKLFRNGELVATNTDSVGALPVSGSEWAVGSTGFGWGDFYAGGVDEVAVYDKALSDAQIKAHFQAATSAGVAPSLSISVAGATVTVVWPASAVGYSLQSAANLASGSWSAVPGVTGNSFTIQNPTGQVFYRLSK